jgi:hypothetical protein
LSVAGPGVQAVEDRRGRRVVLEHDPPVGSLFGDEVLAGPVAGQGDVGMVVFARLTSV